MTSVEAEIAFGLENLGLPRPEMFRRVAEVMTFLNLLPLRDQFTAALSGGEKQKLVLGSVIAMHPRILVLDEPTSQLDPVAATDIFNLVESLNREMGYTVILIEQRLERCFHLADRLVVMEEGKIICDQAPGEAARWQVKEGLPFIPPVARFFAALSPRVRLPRVSYRRAGLLRRPRSLLCELQDRFGDIATGLDERLPRDLFGRAGLGRDKGDVLVRDLRDRLFKPPLSR